MTRRVERRGPVDEHDQHGKLAEDALIEALAERRTSEHDEITLDTKIVTLVGQHIDRLAEDGRSIRTIDTYKYAAKLLSKIIAGVRVGESTPARIDAAVRSMRRAHGDVMAVQSKTLLKGALHLAVMANVMGPNPVRDVSPIRSKKTGQKGAPALTAAELRGLLAAMRASEYCQRNDLVDPTTIFIATGLRVSELLGLRWTDFDEHAATLSVTGKLVRAAGRGLLRVDDETKTVAGRRTVPLSQIRGGCADAAPVAAAPGRAADDLPVDGGHLARPRQLSRPLAQRTRGPGRAGCHVALVQEIAGDLNRRRRVVGQDRRRPPGATPRVSETQDTYMARGRVHTEVADLLAELAELLDRRIDDE